MQVSDVESQVQNYYGKELKSSQDLKTNACCTAFDYPAPIKEALKNIHDEVMAKYYGCGLTIPTQVRGKRILDLGSGSGRDCYLLSQLVGADGDVVGIDMTDEQLEVAQKHVAFHMDKFKYKRTNVRFVKGNIQDLKSADLASDSFDIIVSNCVVNLAENKQAVLREAHRVLKEGGEFYFSDVYCDRRVPEHLIKDKELYGECLSGALYWNDFHNLAKAAGFKDPRIVESHPISIDSKTLETKVGGCKFYSVTYRLFKLSQLDAACEDYGQAIIYRGSVEEEPNAFRLDNHHLFTKGKTELVCGNTWRMVNETRYRDHFEYVGDFSTHFGTFPGCGMEFPYETETGEPASAGCC